MPMRDRGQDRRRRRVGDQVGQDRRGHGEHHHDQRGRSRRDRYRIPSAMHGRPGRWSPRSRPGPTDPARMNSTFQSSARAAERGREHTGQHHQHGAARPRRTRPARARTTRDDDHAARMRQRDPGLARLRRPAGGVLPESDDSLVPRQRRRWPLVTKHVAPGTQRGLAEAAPSSARRSPGCRRPPRGPSGSPCSPVPTETWYRRCGDRPNRGLPHSAATPASVAANTSTSPASIGVVGGKLLALPLDGLQLVVLGPRQPHRRGGPARSAIARRDTGISTRQSWRTSARRLGAPRSISGRGQVDRPPPDQGDRQGDRRRTTASTCRRPRPRRSRR